MFLSRGCWNSKLKTKNSKLISDCLVVFKATELSLPRIHFLIREPEVVADLVQQGELDLMDELAAGGTGVEQRPPVEHNHIRQHVAVPAATLVERNPGIETEESVMPRIEVEISESFDVWRLTNLNRDI